MTPKKIYQGHFLYLKNKTVLDFIKNEKKLFLLNNGQKVIAKAQINSRFIQTKKVVYMTLIKQCCAIALFQQMYIFLDKYDY